MNISIAIIIITCLVSIAAFNNHKITQKLIFDPYQIRHKKEWWRFFTCGLLHGDYFHLFVNMFVLFSFGQAVEHYYAFAFGYKSTYLFVLLYITSIFASNLSTYYKFYNSHTYRSLGASGAVSAIVFTSILFNPYAKIYLYAIIGLPGIVLGIAYLIYSYYMSQKQSDNINHEAHFYGAIFGMLFTIAFEPRLLLVFIKQLLMLG